MGIKVEIREKLAPFKDSLISVRGKLYFSSRKNKWVLRDVYKGHELITDHVTLTYGPSKEPSPTKFEFYQEGIHMHTLLSIFYKAILKERGLLFKSFGHMIEITIDCEVYSYKSFHCKQTRYGLKPHFDIVKS